MVGLFISKTLYKKTRLKRIAFGVVCGVDSDVSMCALACVHLHVDYIPTHIFMLVQCM